MSTEYAVVPVGSGWRVLRASGGAAAGRIYSDGPEVREWASRQGAARFVSKLPETGHSVALLLVWITHDEEQARKGEAELRKRMDGADSRPLAGV